MFENEKYETLLKSMLDELTIAITKLEGNLPYDVLSAFSVKLAELYANLDRVLNIGFAETSNGIYLERKANEHGVTKKVAVKATGQVTATGSDGAPISLGTSFATANGTVFKTIAAATISGTSAVINVEADIAGSKGNVSAGLITQIPVSISGVSSVTNVNPTTGGVDIETEAALKARLLEKVRNPSTSGNAAHYKEWALSVQGVGDCKVFELHAGAGTVKVVLLDENKRAPSASVVTNVINYIQTVRPIGVAVTVVGATEIPINVSVDVSISSGTISDAQSAIENGIQDYLKTIAFKDNTMRYTKIANVIIDTPNVIDYTTLTVNGGTGNVTIADGSVAVLGTVTVT